MNDRSGREIGRVHGDHFAIRAERDRRFAKILVRLTGTRRGWTAACEIGIVETQCVGQGGGVAVVESLAVRGLGAGDKVGLEFGVPVDVEPADEGRELVSAAQGDSEGLQVFAGADRVICRECKIGNGIRLPGSALESLSSDSL